MNKKVLLILAILLMAVPMAWASSTPVSWIPSEPYASWIHEFHVDEVFTFSNPGGVFYDESPDDGVALETAPGMLSFSIRTWHNRDNHATDYYLGKTKVSLYNSYTLASFLIADIDLGKVAPSDQSWYQEYMYDGNYIGHTNGKGCKTYFVQKRMHTGVSNGSTGSGAQWCYFVTEYGDALKKFVAEAGNRLQLRVECAWYNSTEGWMNYDKRTNCTFVYRQPIMPPTTDDAKWVKDSDGRTAVQCHVFNAEQDAEVRLKAKLAKYGTTKDWFSMADNYTYEVPIVNPTERIYEGDGYLYAQHRKAFQLSKSFWVSNHGCPVNTLYQYSEEEEIEVPHMMLPRNLQARVDNDEVHLSWQVNQAYDPVNTSAFVIERSRTSTFATIDKTMQVAYSSSKTEYECVDAFDERNQGELTFYYRVSRADMSNTDPINPKKAVSVLTNYPTIETPVIRGENSEATISWALSSDGIRTQNMVIELNWGTNTEILDLNKTSFTMTGLRACEPVDIRLRLRDRQAEVSSTNSSYTPPSDAYGRICQHSLSKGFYTDRVLLTWRVERDSANFAHYTIDRANLKDRADADAWVQLGVVNHINGVLNYSYTDQTCVPGEYYMYRITGYSDCAGDINQQDVASGIGFAQPYGVVSGQINYNGRQAVRNVKVSALGENQNNRALYFMAPTTIIEPQYTQATYPAQIPNPLNNTDQGTVEMWVKGDWTGDLNGDWGREKSYLLSTYPDEGCFILYDYSELICRHYYSSSNKPREYWYPGYDDWLARSLSSLLNPNTHWRTNEWNLISFTYISTGSTYELRLYINGEEQANYIRTDYSECRSLWRDVQTMYFGQDEFGKNKYKGEIREIRLWDVVRTADEIRENMDTHYDNPSGSLVYVFNREIDNPTYITGYSHAILPASQADALLGRTSGTVEMWLRPHFVSKAQTILYRKDCYSWRISTGGEMSFTLVNAGKGEDYTVKLRLTGSASDFSFTKYNHVAVSYGVNTEGLLTMRLMLNGRVAAESTYQVDSEEDIRVASNPNPLLLAVDYDERYFVGHMDELRFWNICRDTADIVSSMNGYLNGGEYGLTGYYRFDQENTGELYDLSRTNSSFNQRHMQCLAQIDKNMVPSTDQLSLSTRTDEEGNYILNAVPYTEAGSRYTIVPTLGTHRFSPAQRPLYFNANTSTHNSIDFTDESSFRVSGYVLYENTDYPVEGCTFSVDGVSCVEGTKLCQTDANGYYEISVPVGNHYIGIHKSGHVFAQGGRYPEAATDITTTFDFQQDMTGLNWYDQTKVVLTGRVAGGNIEKEKPHGMQQGKNNIGVARITLSPVAKDKYDLNLLDTVYTYAVPEDCEVRSSATVAAKGGLASRRITIITDSATGEFSALVPPIDLTVDSLTVPSNDEVYFNVASFAALELEKCDTARFKTDSLRTSDSIVHTFRYLAALDAIYLVRPQLSITQHNRTDGMFGVDTVAVANPVDFVHPYAAPIIGFNAATQKKEYLYEVPFFLQGNTYGIHLLCSEQYINNDYTPAIVDTVPVAGSKVILSNGLGKPGVGYSDVFQLDGDGRAYYEFVGGTPNITEPTAGQPAYRCSFSASYTNAEGDVNYDWEGNKTSQAVVLGVVPMEGENFITEGPSELIYILRDPPGSKSTATLKKGTTFTRTDKTTTTGGGGAKLAFTSYFGLENQIATGGLGFMTIQNIKSVDNLEFISDQGRTNFYHTQTTTTTVLTEDISTESGESYVGAAGDVYIGMSTNLNFSDVMELALVRDEQKDSFYLAVDQSTAMSRTYKTSFAYSQNHMEKVQLPLMRRLRNQLLNNRITQYQYDHPDSLNLDPTKFHYLTMLSEDDPHFGEEGTYRVVPSKTAFGQDMVRYYNNEIATWKARFADNERAKVKAIRGGDNNITSTNYSVDGGVVRTFSETHSSTINVMTAHERYWNFTAHNKFGFAYNSVGFTTEQIAYGVRKDGSYATDDTQTTTTVNYTMNLNDGEQLSVNVIKGADSFSPIFSTMGGQTRCPYEGAEMTKYYEPGKYTLSTATQRMENPIITVADPIVSGIPAGGHAIYELHLRNEVVTTLAANLQLMVDNTTNPHGAQLSVAGAAITNTPMPIRMQPGTEAVVLLELRQTDLERLDYEDIEIRFTSQCSPNMTSSAVKISAHFVASCPEVHMMPNKLIANSEDPTVLFRISDYDCSVRTFEKIRLEYKKTTDADFTQQIAEFDRDTLSRSSVFTYRWDMSALVDGEYEVRVVGVCRLGNEEILYEGAPVRLTKDVAIPQALGLPSPINGIYSNDNEVYVTFNEPINTALIKQTDVEVMGVMNGGMVCTDIALAAQTNGRMAETEASFVLENTSFSLEAWVRIDSLSAGSLIGIGDKYRVNVTDEGRLLVQYEIGNARYTTTSDEKLPLHKWFYLCVQQELQGESSAVVHAYCAYDSYSLTLINTSFPAYSATAPIRVLADFQSAVSLCELQLWREYRDWSIVQSTIYQTKELYRNNLYGYWPMHDGRGTAAKEMMRGRNMVLPGENWRYKDTNRALHISEQTMAVVDLSDKPIIGEDYALEFWFRRTEPGALYANVAGVDTTYMILTSSSIDCRWGNTRLHQPLYTNFCDGAWHHLAFIVRRQSDSEVLIDGKPYMTSSASSAVTFEIDNDLYGALYFSPDSTAMDIDELRIWKATITPDWIKDNMRNRVRPNATGLLVNFPMEDDMLADVAADALYQHPSLQSRYDSIPLTRAADAPAMVAIKNEQVVPHTFTASDTKLVINITAKPSEIEGQTLNFLVKSLPDTHNNFSKDVRWSAYVHRNLLEWDDQERTFTKEVLNREQIALKFTNRSGNIESWTISGLPDWMSVSESTGSLAPLTTKTVMLTIDESLAIGHYEPVIYLSGNQGIYDALPLHIQVTGDRPDWSINPANFAYSMNIIGVVYQAEGLVTDTTDMIAAKINGKLAGVAHPEFTIYRGIPYVMMDIYANLTDKEMQAISRGENGPKVEFEYWNAQTGLVHTNVITQMASSEEPVLTPVYFKDGALVGTQSQPLQFLVGNTIRQEINVVKGWNWYSFNVLPLEDMLNEFLLPLIPYTSMIKTQDSYAELDSVRQLLVGSLDRIDITKMYRAQMFKNGVETLMGLVVNPAALPFAINPGWNWIGYVPNMTLSVNAAMANMHAQDGDIIKGQRGFATYYNGQWVGSLRAMTPGAGYMYYSSSDRPIVFYYPSPSSIILSPMRAPEVQDEDVLHYTPVDRSLYSGNMTITAIVMDGNSVRTDVEVGVFAGSECRTAAHATDDRYFITVPGDDATPLQLRIWDGQKETIVEQTLVFVNDAQYGTYNEPYIIQIGDAEGVDAIGAGATYDGVQKVVVDDMVYIIRGGEWFDVLGHKVNL